VQFLITRNHAAAEGVSSDLPDTDPADGTRVQHVVHAAGPGGAEVSVYVVQGGGHTWPGGLQYLPERSIGKTCRDIDACDTIWAFFHDHPRP
jgi:polyhydroxybutyrate depolymerase